VVSFSGSTLVVRPDGETSTMRITVRPATKVMAQASKTFSDIQVDDFIGATLGKNSMGVLTAQEVHIFPKTMHGAGDGLYPSSPGSPRMILNGTVGQINQARLGIKFRGATGEGPYNGGTGCSGRAPADPLGGCQGSVIIVVPNNTPVLALQNASASQVKPGDVLALSIMSGPDGKPATPGFTIETVATPPVPLADPAVTPKPGPPPAPKSAVKNPPSKNPK
jgi:hypothetical protein